MRMTEVVVAVAHVAPKVLKRCAAIFHETGLDAGDLDPIRDVCAQLSVTIVLGVSNRRGTTLYNSQKRSPSSSIRVATQ